MEVQFFVLWLLVSAVAVVGKPAQELENEESCAVDPRNRWECGWLGIDEHTCLKRGCCWDSSISGAKYCFVKKFHNLPDGLCPVAPSERDECGYYGITKKECLSKTCCWDESVEGAKWCFKQPEEEPTSCYIYHGISGTCQYVCDPGVRKIYGKGECKGKICCV